VVAAAVGGVAPAGDVAARLARVEQGDEDARVHPHRLPQFALTERTLVVEQSEDLELPRLEVVRGVRDAQATHRLVAEQRQHQPTAVPVLLL